MPKQSGLIHNYHMTMVQQLVSYISQFHLGLLHQPVEYQCLWV